MSIWASIPSDEHEIPERDQYSGAVDASVPVPGWWDVATARSWHRLIRVCLHEPAVDAAREAEVLLTLEEAEAFANDLLAAVALINDHGQPTGGS